MRGHEKSVISFAWCPVPINILRRKNSIDDGKSNADDAENDNVQEEIKDCTSETSTKSLSTELKIDQDVEIDKAVTEHKGDIELLQISKNDACDDTSEVLTTSDNCSEDVFESNDNNTRQIKPEDEGIEIIDQVENVAIDLNTPEYLLASSAMGGPIYIWRTKTDGQIQRTLNMGKKKGHRAQQEKPWITLCWIKSNILLSSSPQAELMQWNLLDSKNK